jgi:hypothetical protein
LFADEREPFFNDIDPTRTSDRRARAPSPANIQSKLGANSTSILALPHDLPAL